MSIVEPNATCLPEALAVDRARELLASVDGVASVADHASAEAGAGVASFHVEAARDVREAIAAALVKEGAGLLELKRTERELESVFLELAGPTAAETKERRDRQSARKAARIRALRPPEPYKGKGIRYAGEVIRRKAGKSGKAGKK